jgi:hypothetical protein
MASLERMGYQLVPNGMLNSGKTLTSGYVLISPGGETLDNDGMGYASSSAAYSAALKHRANPSA